MYSEEESMHLIRLVRRFSATTGLSNFALARLLKVSHATTRRWLSQECVGSRIQDSIAIQVQTVLSQLDAAEAATGVLTKIKELPLAQRVTALQDAINALGEAHEEPSPDLAPFEPTTSPDADTNC